MLGMISGIENGLTRSGPRSSSSLWQSWNAFRPPMPVAIAAPMRSGSASIREPGVGLGLAGRRHDQVCEAVHAPGLLAVDVFRRVEALHLAGEVDGELARVELRDLACAGAPGDECVPGRLDIRAERGKRSEAGDHDPAPAVHAAVRHLVTSRARRRRAVPRR
jgi:hypothetical protein